MRVLNVFSLAVRVACTKPTTLPWRFLTPHLEASEIYKEAT